MAPNNSVTNIAGNKALKPDDGKNTDAFTRATPKIEPTNTLASANNASGKERPSSITTPMVSDAVIPERSKSSLRQQPVRNRVETQSDVGINKTAIQSPTPKPKKTVTLKDLINDTDH